MKTCRGCGEALALEHFYKNPNVKDGHLNWCKPCTIARYRDGVRKRSRALLAEIQAIKVERGCADCGYANHPAALEFDHLPGFVKEHRIAQLANGAKRAKIMAEIAKCEVVCANCHRIRTAERLAQAAGLRSTANGNLEAAVPC